MHIRIRITDALEETQDCRIIKPTTSTTKLQEKETNQIEILALINRKIDPITKYMATWKTYRL